jgi:alpha-L-fucosidase 2
MTRLLIPVLLSLLHQNAISSPLSPTSRHSLHSSRLARTWDEGIPLGNGMLGTLVWQKNGRLRLSLDRADLWDLRPMKGLERPEFRYRWVEEQVRKNEYAIVQQYFDAPYEAEAAPGKIPGAALEFEIPAGDSAVSVHLDLGRALCTVEFAGGERFMTFVSATEPAGWYRWENTRAPVKVFLIPPSYTGTDSITGGGSVQGDDLKRLGYAPGYIHRGEQSITYIQQGWGGFEYEVFSQWDSTAPRVIDGAWSISSGTTPGGAAGRAELSTRRVLQRGFSQAKKAHELWWSGFWERSSVDLPDTMIERQWYLEQYKFGSASRPGAPPISLQAIWTADNDRLPPWKGDFHHDLNTELSYWPCYSANHLDEGLPYLDHLQQNRENYRRYTRRYFEADGLAVPGVTTLDGSAMGGWIQYACSPTTSAWLSQHFYLQWRYSADTTFLRISAYPWLRETAVFLEQLTRRVGGARQLPISSSPEIHDNDITAWFRNITNYDLALIRFAFSKAAELAVVLGLKRDAMRWRVDLAECPDFAYDKRSALMIAPGLPFKESHRHFSNAMAIHPLGLIRWEEGPKARRIITSTIERLDSAGPSGWCGYSYSWLANLKARAKDGAGAAKALEIFARAFCSPNSFHLNGDQTKSGYSSATYRPFTLEGNFAFAAGLQEMLLQSCSGNIEVFPAVPDAWADVSFTTLRAEGAFLVSAQRTAGRTEEVTLTSERESTARLVEPFPFWKVTSSDHARARKERRIVEIQFDGPGRITIQRMTPP